MSRLTGPGRGLDPGEANAFYARANESHTVQWKADVYRWQAGAENTLYKDLPIVGGQLSLDASDPIRRRLTLDISDDGSMDLVPDAPNDPLAPFGQVIKLWCRIDRADGSWFDWLKQGEYVIQTTTSEWPSHVVTVECADYASVVDAYLHERKKSYNHMSVRNAIVEIVKDALPDREFHTSSCNDAKKTKVEKHTIAEAGTSRWETVQAIAQSRGFEVFFNFNGNLCIRHDRTKANRDTIPGTGPDIGSVSSPAAIIRDGEGGNLVSMTVGVSREGACNGVFITIHETVSQTVRAKKAKEVAGDEKTKEPDWDDVLMAGGTDVPNTGPEADPDDVLMGKAGDPFPADDEDAPDDEVPKVPNPKAGDRRVNVQVKALATGAIKWGDKFGRVNYVEERNVKVINNSVIHNQKKRAKRMLHRRGGVVRSIDIEAVGLYWLEPDDRIRVQYEGRTEAHYVASCQFDLSGQEPAHIRTRSLAVEDPG